MQNIKEFIITFIYENRILSAMLIATILFIIISLTKSDKIVIYKRLSSPRYNALSKKFATIIDKLKILKDRRDKLTIDLALITKKNSKSNKIMATNIFTAYLVSIISLEIIIMFFIENIILKCGISVLIICIGPILFGFIISKRRKKAKEDFAQVVSTFTSYYAFNCNILTSLQKSIVVIPATHKYEFSRLITAMQSQENYKNAIDEYALRINISTGYIFAEILKAAIYNNQGTIEALIELENLITVDKYLQERCANKINKRKSNIILWMIFSIVFTFMDYNLLGNFVKEFYLNTLIGQAIIFMGTIIILIVILVCYIMNQV